MAADRTPRTHGQPAFSDDRLAGDPRILAILKRYSAGALSPREAAREIGDGATEHDVYAGILATGLKLPEPPEAERRQQVADAQAMLKRHGWKSAQSKVR